MKRFDLTPMKEFLEAFMISFRKFNTRLDSVSQLIHSTSFQQYSKLLISTNVLSA